MKELEVYIHIPFCAKKCNYCDFLSFPKSSELQESYIRRLCDEIKMSAGLFGERPVSSVFIGGGTPSLLDPYLITELMETLRSAFRILPDAEITIECNPGSTLRHKFAKYRDAGINRLSIGLQSANNEELKTLGRIHSFEEFLKCYQGARMEGFDNINVDLISCFPTQTPESWKKTLKTVLMLKPEHVSVYDLQLEEGTPFFASVNAGVMALPPEEVMTEIDSITSRLMAQSKYGRYEISNYAKPGKESRHNLGYWTGRDYLGFGLGASSLINGVRFKNGTSFEKYLGSIPRELDWDNFLLEKQNVEILSEQEKMREFMILGLRLSKGVGSIEFYRKFGRQLADVYGDILEKYEKLGLLEKDGYDIRLTDRGFEVANTVMCEF